MDTFEVVAIDDEKDIFTLYKLFLKKELEKGQLKLTTFEAGKECISYFQEQDLDFKNLVVFCDINMPEMDGYEVLGELSKLSDDIRVYMVTAYSRDDYRSRALAGGAVELISKPVNFQDLKELILKLSGLK